jgi:hypothetical protein
MGIPLGASEVSKLDILAGKAMGWELSSGIDMYSDDQWFSGSKENPHTECQEYEWNPSTCTDDALILLEKISKSKSLWWNCYQAMNYRVQLVDVNDNEHYFGAELTLPFAMTVCALRASGVSEKEIQDALK